jgi:FtsZ-binding cell division protein ZapB
MPIDRISGLGQTESMSIIPLHKEIQYRDDRIQVLQAEIEHLRQTQAEIAKQVDDDVRAHRTAYYFTREYICLDVEQTRCIVIVHR